MLPQALIYDNPKAAMVAALNEVFEEGSAKYPILSGVSVSTRKAGPEDSAHKQVVITGNGHSTISDSNDTRRGYGFYIHIWTQTYSEAEELAELVEASVQCVRGIHGIGAIYIDMSAVDATENEGEEYRLINVTAIMGASSFAL